VSFNVRPYIDNNQRIDMGIEYKIRFQVPTDYDSTRLFDKLPSPIHLQTMTEIYNYSIESGGFYFIDHLVDRNVASMALRLFIDEALLNSDSVEIIEP
jgi:hypothetical protein